MHLSAAYKTAQFPSPPPPPFRHIAMLLICVSMLSCLLLPHAYTGLGFTLFVRTLTVKEKILTLLLDLSLNVLQFKSWAIIHLGSSDYTLIVLSLLC